MGLRRLEDLKKERRKLPRMADFAQWGFAVAPAIRWSAEDFDRAYRANRNEAFEAAIEDDPIAPHILSLLERQKEKSWQGTTDQLWTRIKEIAGEAARAMNFPQSSVALGRALRRIEPALAARGVIMQRDRVAVGSRVSLRATA
jgi:putative DNA primase/helicase